MYSLDIIWRVYFRKKSYFSLYSKLNRKKGDILDFIWARIIFDTEEDIYSFCNEFEQNHVFIKKKDYIKKPKENWYKSIHYTFITTYKDLEMLVELQLRTKDTHSHIRNAANVSHFSYTIKENKWDKLFEEVHFWHKYIMKSMKTKKSP